ncbi:MAG TPA: 50S ribosomal protein L21 [Thermoanaerobaculia bacterium]|nr:50S ribosomal protein L21 [Thermoanaerobaculia bacterium]
MYAIIETGGKQYRVTSGDVIEVERGVGAAGETIEFPRVLLVGGNGEVRVGSPALENTTVRGVALAEVRGPKIRVFKKKRRKQYRRTNGHRQNLLRVRIEGIG